MASGQCKGCGRRGNRRKEFDEKDTGNWSPTSGTRKEDGT